MQTVSEMIAAARARGVPEDKIQATVEPFRTMAAAIVRVSDAASACKALDAEDAALAQEATNCQEDLAAARMRAQPHLDAARQTVAPYEEVLNDLARRRVELAERRMAAQQQLQDAREAEARAFSEGSK